MFSRRSFLGTTLRSSSLVALSSTVPDFLSRSARAAKPAGDDRVLVVIELNGGNDGINTVVPYRDEGYRRHRSATRLATADLIKIDDQVGLHPSMPDTARPDNVDAAGSGWIGRALDGRAATSPSGPGAIFVGAGPSPAAVRGRRSAAIALDRTDDFLLGDGAARHPLRHEAADDDELTAFIRRSTLDAYATADRMAAITRVAAGRRYPATRLAGGLEQVSRLIKAGIGARFYYVIQGGYDTHAGQIFTHASLLGELSGAIGAFLDDLTTARLAERVAVLCFSEFGRRVADNGSNGTDHGTAGPVFLAGAGVRPGLVGRTPSLTDLEDGDLKVGLDFRRVYAAVLDGWLGLPAEPALGGAFGTVPLFRA